MLRTTAIVLGVLIAAAPSVAGPDQAGADPTPQKKKLFERVAWPEVNYEHPPTERVRLAVKFYDGVRARPMEDGSVASLTARDVTPIDNIVEQYGVQFVSIFGDPKNTPERVRAVEDRAAAISGRRPADLYGMMYVEGPRHVLEDVGNKLLQLDLVEYAYFKVPNRLHQIAPEACCTSTGCGDTLPNDCLAIGGRPQGAGSACADGPCGACCIDSACQDNFQEAVCEAGAIGGTWQGAFTTCEGVDCAQEPECGAAGTGSCWTTFDDGVPQWNDLDGNGTPFCDDATICEAVGEIRPGCIEEDEDNPLGNVWDQICADFANSLFGIANVRDWCGNPYAEGLPGVWGCFTAHGLLGCENENCCRIVSLLDTTCHENNWDANCVAVAQANCTTVLTGGNRTPNFTGLQGYRTSVPYATYYGGNPPAELLYPAGGSFTAGWDFIGYTGEGYNLFDYRMETDPDNANPYSGVYGLGRELFEVYGMGDKNGARGRNVRVGVVEWSAYLDHEDLNVALDPDIAPNDSLLFLPEFGPDHATACLGIINARENGRGVTGIAPDAQAYFFPLTTVLQPGRGLPDCVVSILNYFRPGDVISCSFGPGAPYYNLSNDPFDSELLNACVLAGISVCVSAGNDSFNLDNATNDGDKGITVVGACEPGSPYCRLGFSNYWGGENTDEWPLMMSAWGSHVTTTGYGNLYSGDGTPQRDYTSNFGGTSAASPMIAGLVACAQGLSNQIYGIPIPAWTEDVNRGDARSILGTFFTQCGVDEEFTPGFTQAEYETLGDHDYSSGPNRIKGFPVARSIVGSVLTGGWFSTSGLIDELKILRGTLIFGNVNSIRALDGNYLVVRSKFTRRRGVGAGTGAGPEGQVTYLATGETVDLMITGHSDTASTNSLAVDVWMRYPGQTSFAMVELYDWTSRKWAFVDFNLLTPEAPRELTPAPPGLEDLLSFRSLGFQTQRFVSPDSDRKVLIRLWTFGFGGAFNSLGQDPSAGRFNELLDHVDLLVSQEFGQFIDP